MNIKLTDPVLLICVGVLLAGLASLFWALWELIKGKPSGDSAEAGFASDEEPVSFEPAQPLESSVAPAAAGTHASGINKEVADRLDAMYQRLAEMQSVLSQQASQAAAAASMPGMSPRGFSPETIDKLLKIIGNVIQQVDLLHNSLNASSSNIPLREAPDASLPAGGPQPSA